MRTHQKLLKDILNKLLQPINDDLKSLTNLYSIIKNHNEYRLTCSKKKSKLFHKILTCRKHMNNLNIML